MLKAGTGEEELAENKGNIEDLIDKYVDECASKVSKGKLWGWFEVMYSWRNLLELK